MSAPSPDRPRSRTPPRQQPSAIRVVPYSPSQQRPWDALDNTAQPQSGAQVDPSDPDQDDRTRSIHSSGTTTSSVRPGQGTVASSHSNTAPWLLPKHDHGVSGSATTASRGRHSASSYTTHTSQSSRYSTASSHVSDAEPSSSTGPSPTPGKKRPNSRRRNFVAVLNEDKKTFSLVPQRPRPDPEPQSQSEQPQLPRSDSALSDYGSTGAGFKHPQLPFFPTTPRVSQSSSHEGYTSYASSQYDRPSSAFTSSGTIPDRSITPNTPVPTSPGSSTVQDNFTDDYMGDFASSPLGYRLKGALRKVPDSADLKGKEPAPSPTSDTTEIPLPPVPETTSPTESDDNWQRYDTEEERSPTDSNTPSNGSEDTNFIVYQQDSGAASEAELPVVVEGEEEDDLDDSQLDPGLRPQASFNTQRTASTGFDTTNIQIYGHSSSEASVEAFPQPGADDSPSDSESGVYVPALRPQTSFLSVQSAASTASDATNYRIYGHSSPGLPPVPETEPLPDTRELRPEKSFLSVASTATEATNYKIYGHSSPAALGSFDSFNPPSPCGSYSPLIALPPASFPLNAHESEAGPSGTANTEANYVVHDESRDPSFNESPDPSPPGTALRQPRRDFSDDSLVVPPLRPKRQISHEGFGYYRSRSRSTGSSENLRTKKSGKSLNSISSIINEEAAEFFYAGQAFLNGPAGQFEPTGPLFDPTVAGPSDRQRQLDQQRQREQKMREAASWAEGTEAPAPPPLPVTPHQWSSQLSTVMSESEPPSSTGGSRQASLASVSLPGSAGLGSTGRRGSRWSSHSRQMLSISSSLAGDMENISHSRSNSDPERPSPTFRPPGFHVMVRDHDEDGDGLADLQQVTPRPSRQKLSDMYAGSNNSSERNLHSSQSTRSRASSLSATLPTWAKVYYGSGERKWLRSTSISSMSDLGSGRPVSMVYSASPSFENGPSNIHAPRRRPRDGEPSNAAQRQSTTSMDIENLPTHEELGIRRGIRRMTSSLWSPHLRRDIRAQDRYSIWDPPSVAWSAESGMFGRRNLQVVLFVVGFIFPFAWMIGGVLPLPKPSPLAMIERYSSISDLGIRSREHEFERHIESVDELRYQNARWWRTLNRGMSVIGLLIIGAVIGLAVASVEKGWS